MGIEERIASGKKAGNLPSCRFPKRMTLPRSRHALPIYIDLEITHAPPLASQSSRPPGDAVWSTPQCALHPSGHG